MMPVEWSDPALEDLADIVSFISKDSPYYARKFAEKIFDTTDRLADFSHSGRKVPEADDALIREVIVQDYWVIYRMEPSRILVLAVMHGRRDLANLVVL
jgi:toxin ParE1/3/4